jgi:tyrosyl-tRNA synthetase
MTKDIKAEAIKQLAILEAGAEQSLPEGDLLRKLERSLAEQKPLRVKFGVDPTSPDLHLGHAVPLRKLRRFQELGHTVYLLIGDFTARIGDPSQRDVTRPQLTKEKVDENAATYVEQAFKILDKDRTVLTRNSDWLAPLTFEELLGLTSHFTVARMLERDDFQRRYREQLSIGLHEFLYPVMQAYDSVAIESDVELGGTDQVFNLLAGRELQRSLGQEPQCIMTMPILVGLDGEKKMSKSLGNHIALTDTPAEMFGKAMSISDEMMIGYFLLATSLHPEVIGSIKTGLEAGKLHPARVKRQLACEIVQLYWGMEAAAEAEDAFDRLFRDKQVPEEIPYKEIAVNGSIWIGHLLKQLGLATSTSEARRLIGEGAVKLNGGIITDTELDIPAENLQDALFQRGKRHFVRVKVVPPQG